MACPKGRFLRLKKNRLWAVAQIIVVNELSRIATINVEKISSYYLYLLQVETVLDTYQEARVICIRNKRI